jgi:hypothetical protein
LLTTAYDSVRYERVSDTILLRVIVTKLQQAQPFPSRSRTGWGFCLTPAEHSALDGHAWCSPTLLPKICPASADCDNGRGFFIAAGSALIRWNCTRVRCATAGRPKAARCPGDRPLPSRSPRGGRLRRCCRRLRRRGGKGGGMRGHNHRLNNWPHPALE